MIGSDLRPIPHRHFAVNLPPVFRKMAFPADSPFFSMSESSLSDGPAPPASQTRVPMVLIMPPACSHGTSRSRRAVLMTSGSSGVKSIGPTIRVPECITILEEDERAAGTSAKSSYAGEVMSGKRLAH